MSRPCPSILFPPLKQNVHQFNTSAPLVIGTRPVVEAILSAMGQLVTSFYHPSLLIYILCMYLDVVFVRARDQNFRAWCKVREKTAREISRITTTSDKPHFAEWNFSGDSGQGCKIWKTKSTRKKHIERDKDNSDEKTQEKKDVYTYNAASKIGQFGKWDSYWSSGLPRQWNIQLCRPLDICDQMTRGCQRVLWSPDIYIFINYSYLE